MIEMKCPACGAEGRAPRDKVNTRLVCRKCLKVFHVTPTGNAVLGPPPEAGLTSAKTETTPEFDPVQLIEQLTNWSRKLASPAKSVAIIAAAIVLLVGAFFLIRGESLQDRVRAVARAALKGDTETMKTLAVAGTGDDMLKWFETVRPACGALNMSLGDRPPVIEIVVTSEDSQRGVAEVLAKITSEQELATRSRGLPEATIGSAMEAKRNLELAMVFTSEGWGGWRLDGKRTLAGASKGP